jgi:2-oxoglutarate ferredoxin oxidoreductase subunit delta
MKLETKEVIIIPERCKGCGFCIEFCPKHILFESAEINSKGYHPVYISDDSKCTRCDICGMVCPDFAIGVVSRGEKPGSG